MDVIDGWNYPQQQQVVNLIVSHGCPPNFNIAATMQGDTRFYDLRYLLEIRGCPPLAVDKYHSASTLFVVASTSRNPQNDTVWEIDTFRPFKISDMVGLNDQLNLFRLDK